MLLLLVYVTLALGVSFLCSILEAVLLSISPSYMARIGAESPELGRRLTQLKDNVDQPLAAILSLNTIAHTVGAVGAGAQAANIFGQTYVGMISAILTFLILVVSEIIPKTLGALYWRRLTPMVIRLLGPLTRAMWPLVKMAEAFTRLFKSDQADQAEERDEILALAGQGSVKGVLNESEARILKNLFRLRSVRIEDIMTPRTVIFSLDESLTVNQVMSQHPKLDFSRIPIYKQDKDHLVGFVLKSDLLQCAANGRGDLLLTDPILRRDILTAPLESPLIHLFEQMIDQHQHMALMMDQYSGVEGLVTLEDLMENLIGLQIIDESDPVHDMRELARQKWRKRAKRMGLEVD